MNTIGADLGLEYDSYARLTSKLRMQIKCGRRGEVTGDKKD